MIEEDSRPYFVVTLEDGSYVKTYGPLLKVGNKLKYATEGDKPPYWLEIPISKLVNITIQQQWKT